MIARFGDKLPEPVAASPTVAVMSEGMTIVGYAVINGRLLEAEILAELRQLGEAPDDRYGALFIYETAADGTRSKWTRSPPIPSTPKC